MTVHGGGGSGPGCCAPHPGRRRQRPCPRDRLLGSERTRWSHRPRAGRIRPAEPSYGEAVRNGVRAGQEGAQVTRLVYELRVRGSVPPEVLEEIGAEDFGEEPPLTILRTEPTDQPGLAGVLQRLRSLGLDLMEVRTAGPDPADLADIAETEAP